jgi:hypothetical protein
MAAVMRIFEQNDIVQLLRTEVEGAGSQLAWAAKNGIDRTFLNQVLRGKRTPSPKMIRALGLRIVVVDGKGVKRNK